MKGSRKKSKYQLVTPSHKDKQAPAELELLHTRALLCIRNFTHYKGGDEARSSVERLCKDYKKHKDEVRKNLQKAFAHIVERKNEKGFVELEGFEDRIKEAKKVINEVAKKVWG